MEERVKQATESGKAEAARVKDAGGDQVCVKKKYRTKRGTLLVDPVVVIEMVVVVVEAFFFRSFALVRWKATQAEEKCNTLTNGVAVQKQNVAVIFF